MAAATADRQIFKEVFFSIIQGPKLGKDAVADLEGKLVSFGGVKVDLLKDEKTGVEIIDLQEVSHIIAEDIEFSYYPQIEQQKNTGEVDERMIPVVTPKWVTESIAKSRMLHVRAFNPDPRYFFSGIQVTAADLPEGDKEAIYGGVLALGGQYSSQLTKLTTHLVAINLENDRCRQAIDKKLNIKIVLPHWFDDCLKLNRRIPEDPYLLPNAEIEQKVASDPLPIPTLDFNFIHAHPDGKQGPPEVTRKFKDFVGKRFYFARDLKLHQQLLSTLETIINNAGGEVVKSLQSANVVLCNWRQCDEYVQGSRKGMDVGNLTWLYWMIAKGQWASPLKMLLHYPRDKNGVPGMENMIITVSNYGGDARLYLENLIEACGARFTRAMKTENTHLITARDTSDKCAAAREWGIEMVNHLWLEETYAKYQVQPISNLKYTTFPKRTNLMEVVGQTRVDLAVMQDLYWDDATEDVDMTDAPDTSRITNVTTDTVGPSSGAPEPTSSMSEITPRPEKTKTKSKAKAPHETPSRIARLSSPVSVMSSGSRRAKDNANIKLHNEIMPDVMNYEKEKKRKGGVLGGGRKRSLTPTNDKESDRNAKRRGVSADAEPENSDTSGDETTTKDKTKKSKKKVPISVFLLLTAHQPWLDTPNREEGDKKKLRAIGIQCIENPDSSITHLSAPHMVRTQKFVCALAYAPIIVSASWVEACLSSSSIVDTSPHILHDTAGESRLNLKLSDSLARAKKNKQNLLKGMHIYMTPSVPGGFETLKKVIEVNGGVCTMFKTAKRNAVLPPSAAKTKQNTKEDDEDDDEESEGGEDIDDGRLLLLSTTDDAKIWKPFEKMAEQVGWKPMVYKTEWLLDVAMRQKLLWGDEYVLQQQGKR